MSDGKKTGDRIHGEITGDVSGQAAIGKDITQQSRINAEPLTVEERAELDRLLAGLRERVAAEAPAEEREAALDRVDEIEEELSREDPDPVTLAYVGRWFVRKLPALASGVVSLVVHPLVGKLVGAAGEELAAQLRGHLGGE